MSERSVALASRINARCDEFERAWKDGPPPQIEPFAQEWEGAERAALLRELIGIDAEYRIASASEMELPDYANRFPELAPGSEGDREIELPRMLGQYVLLERIGSGGMGTVYRAIHRRMKRDVAVKVLRAGKGDAARMRERFDEEMRAAARLSHPNIVAAYDAGEDGGLPFLVSEFVEGENLATIVQEGGPLSAEVAVDHIFQAAAGLRYAHQQGLIHRDVKPGNLLVDAKGTVRVMDVGLARLSASALPVAEGGGELELIGTPAYMAPEQSKDPQKADARADVYGLGCTLYFLLTGQSVFPGSSVSEQIAAHRATTAPSLVGESAWLNPVLGKMLAKVPEDRLQSMQEVINALGGLREARRQNSGGVRNAAGKRIALGLVCGALVVCAIAAGVWKGLVKRPAGTPATQPALASAQPPALEAPFDGQVQQRNWAKHLNVPALMTNDLGMQFRLIPPGGCWIGSSDEEIQRMLSREGHPEMRQHIGSEGRRTASLAKPIYLGGTEVTAGQFRRFADATGYVTRVEKERRSAFGLRNGLWVQDVGYSWRDLGQPWTDDHPVANITYMDAVAFCDWLTQTARDGARFRLPTESEWEYACRAGAVSTWPFGDTEALLELHAWCRANAGGVDNLVRPVATRSPNAFGLYDMLGNVQELCVVESGPKEEWTPALVLKGGNISGGPLQVRPASRHPTHGRSPEGGFRVVMEAGSVR